MPDEARKQIRSRVRKGALVAFFQPGKNEFFMLGEIVDISEGGLGICYIDVEERYHEALEVSVYGLDNAVLLNRIPCRMMYDVEVPNGPLEALSLRRCGIQFEGISKDHLDQLRQFIVDIGGIDALEFRIWT